MNRHLQTLFFLAVLSFLFTLSVNAQMTPASMSGKVVFQDEPVIGATILAAGRYRPAFSAETLSA